MEFILIPPSLRLEFICRTGHLHRLKTGDRFMFDAAMFALGTAFFALAVLYTLACNRL
jgi:hypothetical protein